MREEILGRIRTALSSGGHGRHAAADDVVPAATVILNAPKADAETVLRRFETELTSVGGRFYAAGNSEDARDYVLKLASSLEIRSAVGWDCDIIPEIGLTRALESAGVKFIADNGSDDFIQQAIDAGLGISGVDYALADSGSLVVLSGPGHARSASLVPPVHVALVRSEQVLPDLNDLFPLLKARGSLSSAIAFITGPSRTADIEMTLVVGVHGPQQLHVVLLP